MLQPPPLDRLLELIELELDRLELELDRELELLLELRLELLELDDRLLLPELDDLDELDRLELDGDFELLELELDRLELDTLEREGKLDDNDRLELDGDPDPIFDRLDSSLDTGLFTRELPLPPDGTTSAIDDGDDPPFPSSYAGGTRKPLNG